MYLYIASPLMPANPDYEVFSFEASTIVCSLNPIKFSIKGSRYGNLITLDMDDADLDDLIEKATAARAKRREQKAETLAKLAESTYDEGAISMETAEKLQYLAGAVIADEEGVPTCDICGLTEESTPHMVWNGDTGLHVACETKDGE